MTTILIVDDQSVSLEILNTIVGSIDRRYQVMTFTSPREALHWATTNQVDLVLTDYQMPKMNGIDFIKILHSHPESTHIPVVMVSAEQDPGIRATALEAGATDYLAKPVNIHQCRTLCRTLLENAGETGDSTHCLVS